MKGFTLVELIVTILIVGILAAIAFPSYEQYVQRSRRTEAQSALLEVAQLQERYYAENAAYVDDLTEFGYQSANWNLSENGWYQIRITKPTGDCPLINCFELQARVVQGAGQDADVIQNFLLSSSGQRQIQKKGSSDRSNGWDP